MKIDLCKYNFKHLIKIIDRQKGINQIGDSGDKWSFVEIFNPFAQIDNLKNVISFNGVQVATNLATHKFTIRWRKNCDIKYFIQYNSKYFEILEIRNINEDNIILELYARESGNTNKGGSY